MRRVCACMGVWGGAVLNGIRGRLVREMEE